MLSDAVRIDNIAGFHGPFWRERTNLLLAADTLGPPVDRFTAAATDRLPTTSRLPARTNSGSWSALTWSGAGGITSKAGWAAAASTTCETT